jgi:5-oxoprolinase (ATP-hydrolysing)
VTTQGLGGILAIGNQSRPAIFDLEIKRPEIIAEQVVEARERVVRAWFVLLCIVPYMH